MLAALGNGVQRDESLFRGVRIVHHNCNLWTGEPIPMRKPPTGEPCAGEPHARFEGRGRREPFPTPIRFVRPQINLDTRFSLRLIRPKPCGGFAGMTEPGSSWTPGEGKLNPSSSFGRRIFEGGTEFTELGIFLSETLPSQRPPCLRGEFSS